MSNGTETSDNVLPNYGHYTHRQNDSNIYTPKWAYKVCLLAAIPRTHK